MLTLPTQSPDHGRRELQVALDDETRRKILVFGDGREIRDIAQMADNCAAGEADERTAIWITDLSILTDTEKRDFRARQVAVCVLDLDSHPQAWLTRAQVHDEWDIEKAIVDPEDDE